MIAPATALARSVDHIAYTLTLITIVFMLLVFCLLGYFCVKYRKGSKASRANRPSSSWKVELANASTMLLISVGLFWWSGSVFLRQYSAPKDALDVYVIGKQWMWMFQVDRGPREIGRLKVPLGRPVRLLLSSDDVIHSFFIPAFRIKQDAVPGRYTSLWFNPNALGRYDVLCSEFCGTSHSAMRATIEVVTPEEFAVYRASAGAPPIDGARVYHEYSCASCHDTGGILAPNLAGLYGSTVNLEGGRTRTADENYLRTSLMEPATDVVKGYRPLMPTYRGQLSESDLAALVAYLKNFPSKGTP